MKNVKSSTMNNLKATYGIDELVEYGRKLHSEAVFMGVLKIMKLFRPNLRKTVQIEGNEGNLKYSR